MLDLHKMQTDWAAQAYARAKAEALSENESINPTGTTGAAPQGGRN